VKEGLVSVNCWDLVSIDSTFACTGGGFLFESTVDDEDMIYELLLEIENVININDSKGITLRHSPCGNRLQFPVLLGLL
jgi:hypothetical protein